MNKVAIMEWSGYLISIAGLLIVLMTFDRPGWMWQAGGAVLITSGILLIYRCNRRRRSDCGYYDCLGYRIDDDIADVMNGD
ncbi:hypothetical protein CR152_20310 [Massilia violaceinigra]|uniref:Uncharacterized protein n=1 Tax=Massilia violaceinigra TaxID=2045208 RepID=A0A2D2DNQ5_9BURK|nr:hypothetical protein [Massilia violaceinigra]ATQ76597.1 hypothetical protein CR152_20310 [Massilia violaceinigra]